MADLDYVERLLEICDNYDLAMIEAGGVKVVFNQALGPEPTGEALSDDDEEDDPIRKLMGGDPPKFNNE